MFLLSFYKVSIMFLLKLLYSANASTECRGGAATLLRGFLSARARVHARTVGAAASMPPLTESLRSITTPPLNTAVNCNRLKLCVYF